MTINKTIKRIGAYRDQIEGQVEKLSDVTPPPLKAVSQIGLQPTPADLLMAAFVDQFADAAARLKAVLEGDAPEPQFGFAKTKRPSDDVIDVTEYRELPDGS